ncbi:MAG: hypothetical protein HQK98_09885 [Nitrospirae bacterium]|nr:hypothetical protein [Nitrospirota bacterium]
MTVEELIKLLQQYPQDSIAKVMIEDEIKTNISTVSFYNNAIVYDYVLITGYTLEEEIVNADIQWQQREKRALQYLEGK